MVVLVNHVFKLEDALLSVNVFTAHTSSEGNFLPACKSTCLTSPADISHPELPSQVYQHRIANAAELMITDLLEAAEPHFTFKAPLRTSSPRAPVSARIVRTLCG
eukprot:6173960-Pleurochrysis_carterae.AAC.2